MKIRIGLGSCGIAAGALKVMEALQTELKSHNLQIEIQQTGCIGMCHNEPLVDIIDDNGQTFTYGKITEKDIKAIIEQHLIEGNPVEKHLVNSSQNPNDFLAQQVRVALRNCGIIDPEQIEHYTDRGGYEALKKAITMSPQGIIEEIKTSGLRGRGGAGFPTWFKWNAARNNPGEIKYIVCNADEGDPGAFMDRSEIGRASCRERV
mgnify:CR=1 FL=1